MGKIINGYIMPHPPIIVPGVGKGRELEALPTLNGIKQAVKDIAADRPTTIILSSPHAPCFSDHAYLSEAPRLSGSLANFDYPESKLDFENNLELVAAITEHARLAGISAGGLSNRVKEEYGIADSLDHGAMVPLYFIAQVIENVKLVHIATPFLSHSDLYKLGKSIAAAVAATDEQVVYVASADLSHRLTRGAPAGYHPQGRVYDEALIQLLKAADVSGILNIDPSFMETAGECGTRSIMMLLGAMDGQRIETEIYSYEGPFGVGYLVAKVHPLGMDPDSDVLGTHYKNKIVTMEQLRRDESDCVRLARQTLETYIRENRKMAMPQWIPQELLERQAGVFVSLKKDGKLRGCIGTIGPTQNNIALEITHNAISAGIHDPRFEAVSEEELPELAYSVDILGKPEKIDTMAELDPKRYGVIVSQGNRRGLLLPNLEGINTPEQQVEIALQKAGIGRLEDFEMERFEVVRYH